VPAVAVYLISFPSIFSECLVWHTFFRNGRFLLVLGFSAGFSGARCGCCWAKGKNSLQEKAKQQSSGRRSKHFHRRAGSFST